VSTAPLQARAERLAETTWLGGPPRAFEKVGRMGFVLLLAQGMRPSSRVLDVGCGALRLGYWLMRVLDPGGYHGVEPQQQVLRVGLEQIVEPEVVEHVGAMPASFARASSPSGIFLASYQPATLSAVLAERVPPQKPAAAALSLAAHRPGLARRWPGLAPFTDYKGSQSVGRDGAPKVSGTVRHRFGRIAGEHERHGLAVRQLPHDVVSHQYWLRVERRT